METAGLVYSSMFAPDPPASEKEGMANYKAEMEADGNLQVDNG